MKRVRSVLALVLWFFGACAGVPKQAAKLTDAESRALRHEVVSALQQRNASLNSLRGLASVRYGSKLFGVKGETAFAIQRPNALRIDAMSDFGAFASQVILSQGKLLILWPSQNQYFEGAADRGAIERFLLIGLEANEVVDLLLSRVPLETEDSYRLVKAGSQEVVLRGEQGELTLARAENHFLPKNYTAFDGQGRRLYHVSYDAYHDLLPSKFQAEFQEPKSKIEVLFKDVELNPKMDKKLFEQRIPSDATPLEN